MTTKKINRQFVLLLCIPAASFVRQNNLLQECRSIAIGYNHDLKATDKNIATNIELGRAMQKDLRPKLSGDANFQYTSNPL